MAKAKPETSLKKALDGFELGKVQKYKNMALIPLLSTKKSKLEYMVLEEAVKSGDLEVRETGSVNTLTLLNHTGKDVLFIKGEYVVGGKQNRMMTVNGLLDKDESKVNVPVHCIEKDRWNEPGEFDIGETTAGSLRRGLTKNYAGSSGQQRTWNGVHCLLAESHVSSPTQDFGDLYKGRKQDIKDYVEQFKYVKGQQVGCIVAIQEGDNTVLYLDAFDKADTMKKHYERLLTSYAIDAIASKGSKVSMTKDKAKSFLKKLKQSDMEVSDSISLGKDIEMSGGEIQGDALVHKGVAAYIGARLGKEKSHSGSSGGGRRVILPEHPRRPGPGRPDFPRRPGGPGHPVPLREEPEERELGVGHLLMGRKSLYKK